MLQTRDRMKDLGEHFSDLFCFLSADLMEESYDGAKLLNFCRIAGDCSRLQEIVGGHGEIAGMSRSRRGHGEIVGRWQRGRREIAGRLRGDRRRLLNRLPINQSNYIKSIYMPVKEESGWRPAHVPTGCAPDA